MRRAHLARLRMRLQEGFQHGAGLRFVLERLGQHQHGDLGIGLGLQGGLRLLLRRRAVAARQGRLGAHDVRFQRAGVGRDHAVQHGGGRFLVLGAPEQLLDLEQQQAAPAGRRRAQALDEDRLDFRDIVRGDHHADEVLGRFLGFRIELAPQAYRGQGVVDLARRYRHLGRAARQARIAGLLGQRQHGQIRALPVALAECELGLK